MPISLSHPSQKQSLLAIIGVVVAVILLLLLGNMYGRFLKTQVAPPAESYSASGSIKASVFQDPGTYTLRFSGQTQNAESSADVVTTFQVIASSTPTPNASATPTPTPTPTATPALPY
ncbi:MAG: hypothetical protein A3D99_01130 [Candidatus Andersenbacteria bacterium RIFCSPHIGHO2_12_FULL_45_11]|uniref:Uncharacterized protein n=1 Tax=Candidatus Andersenbacteria bacterium RIFCSPHIGHO2_12_FULL_45_11 TaxID=1797281 RepID=A0A1G1X5E8_9BACT|nr:MAG: hypothetical protein A3D99_01130 [Candidatus Andersenbacteria bacterium RIFCSPHIGHO2_12_FULL_45_11]